MAQKKISVPDHFGGLDKKLLLQMHGYMVKSRVLEERLIKIYRAGESYFWIGGPGEEAWGVPLGMLGRIGHGPGNDFYHLHYRCTPTLIAMGLEMIDSIRLTMNRATDPSTGGRNFQITTCFRNGMWRRSLRHLRFSIRWPAELRTRKNVLAKKPFRLSRAEMPERPREILLPL